MSFRLAAAWRAEPAGQTHKLGAVGRSCRVSELVIGEEEDPGFGEEGGHWRARAWCGVWVWSWRYEPSYRTEVILWTLRMSKKKKEKVERRGRCW